MIQATSSESYQRVEDLGKRQRAVYEVIRIFSQQGEGISNKSISRYLYTPINEVTPRTRELVKIGLVMEGSKRHDQETGRATIFWKTVERQPEDIVGKQFARLRESFGDKGDQTLFSFAI